MKFKLISESDYKFISDCFETNPKLVFQNNGYEYIAKSTLSPDDIIAFNKIESILRNSIEGFVEFNNLRKTKFLNEKELRFQYHWSESFTGVGYILLDELYKGFENETIKNGR